jgi:hypothetical protein
MARRKFELLIADIRRHLAAPAGTDRYNNLWQTTWNLRRFDEEVVRSPEKARLLIELARVARATTGPGCAVAEEKILLFMEDVVRDCGDQFVEAGGKCLPDRQALDSLAPELRTVAQIVAELTDYALDCLHHAARPRDAFAGARRGLALNILSAGETVWERPEALEFACQALRRHRSQEVRGAINFLADYFAARPDLAMPDDIADELLAVAENATSRSTAVGALDLLVKTLVISEWEASDRISAWKDKHYR